MKSIQINQHVDGEHLFGLLFEGEQADLSSLFEVIHVSTFSHQDLLMAIEGLCAAVCINGESDFTPVTAKCGSFEIYYDPRHMFDA